LTTTDSKGGAIRCSYHATLFDLVRKFEEIYQPIRSAELDRIWTNISYTFRPLANLYCYISVKFLE
jgi:hypothetical protein